MKSSATKNRPITLIELLLVITLATIVVGSIGVSIPKWLAKERFASEVKRVEQMIEVATDVMLAYDTDVVLSFTQTGKGCQAKMATAKPVPKEALKLIHSYGEFTQIADIQLDGRRCPLYFSASNGKVPLGKLVCSGKEIKEMMLPGYIRCPVKGKDEKKTPKAIYPEEVLPPA